MCVHACAQGLGLLHRLLLEVDEAGRRLSDEELLDNMIGLFFAGGCLKLSAHMPGHARVHMCVHIWLPRPNVLHCVRSCLITAHIGQGPY